MLTQPPKPPCLHMPIPNHPTSLEGTGLWQMEKPWARAVALVLGVAQIMSLITLSLGFIRRPSGILASSVSGQHQLMAEVSE